MKKLMILSAVAVFAALFTSCGGDKVSLTPKDLTFEATNPAVQTLTVKADGDWTIASDAWILVSPSSGVAGTFTVNVTAANYTETNTRYGNITLTSHGVNAMCRVTQFGYEEQIEWLSNLPTYPDPTPPNTLILPIDIDTNYITGANSVGDLGKFEKLKSGVSGQLKAISFLAKKSPNATGSIKVRVYAANQTSVLVSETIAMDVVQNQKWTDVTLTSPIAIKSDSTYYVGLEWDWNASLSVANDFAIYSNNAAAFSTTTSTAWGLDNSGFYDLKTIWQTSENINMCILAGVVSSTPTRGAKKVRPTLDVTSATTKVVSQGK
jgi:hypothetical protein